jgi:glycogenin
VTETKRAYVTVLSGDSYLDGLLALNESLRRCKSAHPLHVVVGSEVTDTARRVIDRAGIAPIAAPVVEIPDDIRRANLNSDHHKHWSGVFEKLVVFSLSEFEKLVFLDSDMVVIRNIDDLFEHPHMSGVIADIVPGRRESVDLNAGLMVIEPEPGLTARLLDSLPDVFEDEKRWRSAEGRPVSMGVQSVINAFWSSWIDQPELHLAGKYNVLVDHLDYYVRALGYRWRGPQAIRVLHFIGQTKPWMRSPLGSARRLSALIVRRRTSEALALLVYLAVRQRARLHLVRSAVDERRKRRPPRSGEARE